MRSWSGLPGVAPGLSDIASGADDRAKSHSLPDRIPLRCTNLRRASATPIIPALKISNHNTERSQSQRILTEANEANEGLSS
jgi:hypothetical protein